MKQRLFRSVTVMSTVILLIVACAPQATSPTPPPVDVAGTMAVQLAAQMLSQTAAAYTPTPLPPTITPSPAVNATPTVSTEYVATKRPVVQGFAPCWTGPGPNYTLISNIEDTRKVDLLGIGNVEGWYVIRNPYFNVPCWISAEYLQIFTDIDLSVFPVMTPQAR